MPLPLEELASIEDRYWRTVAALDVDSYLELHAEDYLGWPSFADQPTAAAGLRQGLEAFTASVVEGSLRYAIELRGATGNRDSPTVYSEVAWSYESVDGTRFDLVERFAHVWRRTGGRWELLGAMSYLVEP